MSEYSFLQISFFMQASYSVEIEELQCLSVRRDSHENTQATTALFALFAA